MSSLLHSDLFRFLMVVFPLALIGSRASSFFYLKTLKRLKERYGGAVRDRWITYPQFVLPASDGEIMVTSHTAGSSSVSETYATTYFDDQIGCRFHIESKDMPHPSIKALDGNWTPEGDLDFSSRFRAHEEQTGLLDHILSGETLRQVEEFAKARALRIQLDGAQEYKDGWLGPDALPRLVVATSPRTSDLDTTRD